VPPGAPNEIPALATAPWGVDPAPAAELPSRMPRVGGDSPAEGRMPILAALALAVVAGLAVLSAAPRPTRDAPRPASTPPPRPRDDAERPARPVRLPKLARVRGLPCAARVAARAARQVRWSRHLADARRELVARLPDDHGADRLVLAPRPGGRADRLGRVHRG